MAECGRSQIRQSADLANSSVTVNDLMTDGFLTDKPEVMLLGYGTVRVGHRAGCLVLLFGDPEWKDEFGIPAWLWSMGGRWCWKENFGEEGVLFFLRSGRRSPDSEFSSSENEVDGPAMAHGYLGAV